MGRSDLLAAGMGLFIIGLFVRFSCASQSPLCYDLPPSSITLPAVTMKYDLCVLSHVVSEGQKRIMRVQHGGTALLGLFNVLLNAFILSFIT